MYSSISFLFLFSRIDPILPASGGKNLMAAKKPPIRAIKKEIFIDRGRSQNETYSLNPEAYEFCPTSPPGVTVYSHEPI
ncbi:hypothetical protein [Methanolacinia petrolearia]|uniref:hypothetical protein n=1 Tax=Methanolacinia petrolearia TaxID=54120 RepID=UPI001CDB40EB|nr:hypothetical protein [Methanolacinia petrolearia]